MRALILAVTACMAACATERPNPWLDVEIPSEPVEQPLSVPEAPLPIASTEDTVTLDKAGAIRIREIVVVCDANTQMAAEYAAGIVQYREAAKGLVEAGRAQRMQTDLAREMLEDERRAHTFERIGYWAIIGGLGWIAVAD